MFTNSRPTGIIFDAVGTLIEPFPTVAEVYAATARRQGATIDLGTIKARFHQHFRNDEVDAARGPLLTDEALEYRRWRRIVGGVLPEVPDLARAFGELWEHFGRPDSWRCYPDVGPAWNALSAAGVPLAIASNFDGRLRRVLAGLPEFAGWDAAPVISSEVGFRKPHPALYRAACARLGLPLEGVLCVGDDPENDVRGPIRAGLRGLLLDRRGDAPRDLPWVSDLNALADLFSPES